ncbi:PhzF family phenazine biosynthesis protein [Candidatus Halobonum tyrrellensis]|uniref:Phenazine biosynthesis protein n=1 Tax=Candidatus Halobonum tyrrellensis G22 TaxID=1324957 RepID=V4HFM2_9EURY|nr:PhzF family phenazine biosynthesis protein [Candidatus Halobonum tyrrellensis]ESP88878.1 phenazine biosynthesis protein [Candidatus Halobonum tyrrellensis G22]
MTDTREAYLVDAFTDEPLSGNAAGLVPDAEGLADGQMRAIANELGASETAFLLPSEDADRRVRYFTPTTEVGLCGHATVAAHAWLAASGGADPGTHTLETNVGVLDIEIEAGGRVWMTQNAPTIREVEASYDRLGDALGCDPNAFRDVGADLPVAVADTGLPFVVVPVNFLEHLGDMTPDFGAVERLADEYDAAGVYAFTFDALDAESTLHGRCFVPGAGVDEDPVTGTASGACGAYLDRFGAFDDTPAEMRFEQGHYVDRPGVVRVRAAGGGAPTVGGDATLAVEGRVRVPGTEEDDIIEP